MDDHEILTYNLSQDIMNKYKYDQDMCFICSYNLIKEIQSNVRECAAYMIPQITT